MTPGDLVEKYRRDPEPPALAGLGVADWATVSHAHGPATDFPPLLRAAVGDDADDQESAFQLLFETIWHQGTVWEATAHTVPFLYRALEADETPDKQSVVHLLAAIAACQTGKDEHMAASRRAVARRLDLLYPYLRDPEPEIRYAVAIALGHFPEAVARLLPDLNEALRDEPDEDVSKTLRGIIERAVLGAGPDTAGFP
jgi:HEAT repeat protein